MKLSRRDFVLGGVGLMVGGCAGPTDGLSSRPGAPWPAMGTRPTTVRRRTPPSPANRQVPARATAPANDLLYAIPRSRWAKAGPLLPRLNVMNDINRITVHHEGWDVVDFTDIATTARRLESIRLSHLDRLGAGDIGYHFIIDRGGRLWQGRDLRFQGAHVKYNNPHNIGIMVLGNFNEQRPSQQQYAKLNQTLRYLMRQYRVSSGALHTHRELGPTTCPGNVLQWHMEHVQRPRL